jgi:23S rRNA (cytosine1962-C5)-methyltransferase
MNSASDKKPSTLRIRLTNTAETIIRQGHPWVFADSIKSQTREGEAGELAIVFDRKNTFLALGLYDPDSPIRIRILHTGKPVKIDGDWWSQHLKETLAKRAGVFEEGTNGLRWINGESDGWPGLVLDQYAEVLVLKIYTSSWFPHLTDLRKLLQDQLQTDSIVLRLSRNIHQRAADLHLKEGALLEGSSITAPVVFQESGIRFYADVLKGQKTGFFLDQRDNRRQVEILSKGKNVLNLFSFSGGFSLYAARGGAREVTSVDISPHALSELKKNWELNSTQREIRKCPHMEIQADVFEWLEQNQNLYDLIILDPPSLAKREKDREVAMKAYEKLSSQAIQRLAKGGILISASCSAHVSRDEFLLAVRTAYKKSGRRFEELAITGHAPDHPATLPEMDYLKAVYLKEVF